jgi:uroporphyrinogen-III synthase
VLITRPEPGATETAARVAALGFRPVLAPALMLAPRPASLPTAVQAVVITSPAAARALPSHLSSLPVFATGPASAEAARTSGFPRAEGADGDAASLAGLVAARCQPHEGPLLLAVGAGYGQELAAELRRRGFRVLRRVVYAAREAEALPPAASRALAEGEIAAALFFSPRSARAAMAMIARAGLADRARGIAALALSPRIASILRAWPWARIAVAEAPQQDQLLALLGARDREEPMR